MIISRQIPDKDALGLPKGVWISEDDFVLWQCAETGYECFIVRNDITFTLCGYVGLPDTHPLHGLAYHDPLFSEQTSEHGISVHGGLTFSDKCTPQPHWFNNMRPASTWAFGFDTAHAFDYAPALVAHTKRLGLSLSPILEQGTYRTLDYVKGETTQLAKQLRSADINIQKMIQKAIQQKETK